MGSQWQGTCADATVYCPLPGNVIDQTINGNKSVSFTGENVYVTTENGSPVQVGRGAIPDNADMNYSGNNSNITALALANDGTVVVGLQDGTIYISQNGTGAWQSLGQADGNAITGIVLH